MFLRLITLLALLALPAGAAPLRILAFGDSITEGYGLPADQGLVPQLQDWLKARGLDDIEIVNAGASGDTSYGGRVRIAISLRRHAPVDAVLVELGGNDLLMGWSAEQTRTNLDALLEQAGAGGRPLLLAGIANPEHDTALKAEWAAIWPKLARKHDALLVPNIYAAVAEDSRAMRRVFLQDDGVHPSARGVAMIVELIGPKVEELATRARAKAPAE